MPALTPAVRRGGGRVTMFAAIASGLRLAFERR